MTRSINLHYFTMDWLNSKGYGKDRIERLVTRKSEKEVSG